MFLPEGQRTGNQRVGEGYGRPGTEGRTPQICGGSGMSERYGELPEEELPQESEELALVSVEDFYDLLMEQQEQM